MKNSSLVNPQDSSGAASDSVAPAENASKPVRKKTVYCLRSRLDDASEWGEPEYYSTRKKRDRVSAMARIIGGARIHSYEEKKTPDEIAEIFA